MHRESLDVARLRSIHTTAGYREGLSEAKDRALQPGFDEGYSLGAALGMRAGLIVGIVEGLPDAVIVPEGSGLSGQVRTSFVWRSSACVLTWRHTRGRVKMTNFRCVWLCL